MQISEWQRRLASRQAGSSTRPIVESRTDENKYKSLIIIGIKHKSVGQKACAHINVSTPTQNPGEHPIKNSRTTGKDKQGIC